MFIVNIAKSSTFAKFGKFWRQSASLINFVFIANNIYFDNKNNIFIPRVHPCNGSIRGDKLKTNITSSFSNSSREGPFPEEKNNNIKRHGDSNS